MRPVVLLSGLLLSACAAGHSIRPVSASPASVSFRYGTLDSREYPEVIRRAEAACSGYGKHARQAAAPVASGEGYAVATFDCVP